MKMVTLYTREGCHLCEVVAEQLAKLQTETAFSVETVDVDGDPALAAEYGMEVPVVMLDGKKVAKYHLDEDMLRRRLAS
jgi:glutaredoxin